MVRRASAAMRFACGVALAIAPSATRLCPRYAFQSGVIPRLTRTVGAPPVNGIATTA